MKLLNLGCGSCYHHDWVNIDFNSNNQYVVEHNLLKGIPFKDRSIDVVYHSHVLEHFSKNDGENFIGECYRVLKNDGIIRVAVPNLESIAREYLRNLALAGKGDKEGEDNYNWIKLELLDQMVRTTSGGEMAKYLYQSKIPNEEYIFKRIGIAGKNIRNYYLKRQEEIASSSEKHPYIASKKKIIKNFIKNLILKSLLKLKILEFVSDPEVLKIAKFRVSGEIHQWMYDSYSLKKMLIESGFSEVQVCSAFESQIENWEEYQLDVVAGEIRKPDSLFIEARKI